METIEKEAGSKTPTHITCRTCKYEFAGYCNFRVFMGLGERIIINLFMMTTY
jgi:hypothetical protein